MFAAVLTVFGVVVGFGVDFGFSKVKRGEQLAGGAGEGGLVILSAGHFQQRLVSSVTQGVAPEVEDALRRFGGRFAGQTLAGEQGQCLVDRQLVLAGHAVVAFGLAFLRQLGAQVGVDAVHEARADDLDADLFQGVVGVLGFAPGRHALGVDAVVVVAQAQRDGVRLAAQLRHFAGGQGAGGQRQAGALAGHAGGARLERHLDIRLFGDGAKHAGGGPLELLGAGVVFACAAHGLVPLMVG